MTDDARSILDTLFYPFKAEAISCPQSGQSVAFFNAHSHDALSLFKNADIYLQQVFKPEADRLRPYGAHVLQKYDEISAQTDLALVLLPKNQIEGQGLLAHAIKGLKKGGTLCMAAGNKAGGSRLAKHLKAFGIDDIAQETRNRARVVWAVVDAYDEQRVQQAIDAIAIQDIVGGQYVSQPGIYGWDKIDRGSALLAEYLPEGAYKNGADFGCGYGYLSMESLKRMHVDQWHCIDADYRAVQVCKNNIERLNPGGLCQYHWADLTATEAPVGRLDIIVMNPPFHEGQKGKPEIGSAFIGNAANALKNEGELWIVANNHLPYEQALKAAFSTVEKIVEQHGFKVYKAVK